MQRKPLLLATGAHTQSLICGRAGAHECRLRTGGACRFSAPQLLCVAIITLGALSSTLAEAFLGDAASAARSSGSSSGSSSPLAADALIPNSVDSESGARASPTPLRGAISAAFAAVTEKAGVSSGDAGSAATSSSYMLVWITGIGILTLVLAIQSCLGFYQSWTAATFGRSPSETMFYMHVMALPGFVFALSAIPERVAVWNASPATYEALNDMLASGSTSPFLVLLLRLVSLPLRNVPIMWTFVLLNVLTQYVGIVGVYNLTPVVSPLTLNVVLTVRKCVSLLLSIYAFNNTFTVLHWLGALLVFGAALWYGRIQSQPSPTISGTPSASHVAPALSPREDDKATVTVPPSGLEGAKVRQKTLAHAASHHR
ncbi:hypothetical protein EON66_05235 [archaeon]|nr:MAG: hypothetical protein EON66_05235 [archaeon]